MSEGGGAEHEPAVAELVERHRRFWERSLEHPLTARLPHPDWRLRPYPVSGGRRLVGPARILPGDVDIDALLGIDVGSTQPAAAHIEDYMQVLRPAFPVAWMEALIGCGIFASAYSCSAKPPELSGSTGAAWDFSAERALHSPWRAVMDRLQERACSAAAGCVGIAQHHLRGVSDMLAAYLGDAGLCTALIDAPEAVARLAERFSDLYLTVARESQERRPAWRGGYVSQWGVWAPGPLLDYQMDASSMISPQMYRASLAPWDRRILRAFPYTVMHLHACGLHMIDVVIEMDEVRAVEITLERETGRFDKERILAACDRVAKAGRCVIVHGELDDGELGELVDRLDPCGLAIFRWLPREGERRRRGS